MTVDRRIGEHRFTIEDDGLVILEFRGPLSKSEMAEILRAHDGKLVADGDLYSLSDLRGLGPVEPGARHVLSGRPKNLPEYCVAYLAANYRMKLVMDVVIRASNLLSTAKVVHRFFDDVASAREWLRQMRDRRHGQQNAA